MTSEQTTESGYNVCPSGGVIFIDPPRRLDAELLRGIEEMAEFYLRKYGKKPNTTEETQMKKRYKVLFEIEGSIEISARNDEEAGEIIDRMERDRLFELCDEFGCKTYPIEMEEDE
jgi:hypothetical protein